MTEADQMTAERTPQQVIEEAMRFTSNPARVASTVLDALREAGFVVVPREVHPRPTMRDPRYWRARGHVDG